MLLLGLQSKEYGNGFKLDRQRLRRHHSGRVAVRWPRLLPAPPKTVRIVRKADGGYALFTCKGDPQLLPPAGQEVGIEVGVASLITPSVGEKVPKRRGYQLAQQQLRRVSRRHQGGSNWRKAVKVLDKLVHRLICDSDLMAVEALQVRNLVRNQRWAKRILDAGWGDFRSRLQAKAAEAGGGVVEVNPASTSARPVGQEGVVLWWAGARPGWECRHPHPAAGTQPLGAKGVAQEAAGLLLGQCVT